MEPEVFLVMIRGCKITCVNGRRVVRLLFERTCLWPRRHGSSPTVTNCTFSGNTANYGGGMDNFYSSPTVTNCILWGDSPDEIYNSSSSSTPTVSFSNLQGGLPANNTVDGGGNIAVDPLFVDADGPDDDPETWQDNDLRLTAESPCIDVDNNAAIPAGIETDLDGNIRIFNDTVDMGAYEVQSSDTDLCELVERADINCDGIVDMVDLAILAAHWLEGSE